MCQAIPLGQHPQLYVKEAPCVSLFTATSQSCILAGHHPHSKAGCGLGGSVVGRPASDGLSEPCF